MLGRAVFKGLKIMGLHLANHRYRKGSGGAFTRKTAFFIAMIAILGLVMFLGIPILLSSFGATCGLVDRFIAALSESSEIMDGLLSAFGGDGLGC